MNSGQLNVSCKRDRELQLLWCIPAALVSAHPRHMADVSFIYFVALVLACAVNAVALIVACRHSWCSCTSEEYEHKFSAFKLARTCVFSFLVATQLVVLVWRECSHWPALSWIDASQGVVLLLYLATLVRCQRSGLQRMPVQRTVEVMDPNLNECMSGSISPSSTRIEVCAVAFPVIPWSMSPAGCHHGDCLQVVLAVKWQHQLFLKLIGSLLLGLLQPALLFAADVTLVRPEGLFDAEHVARWEFIRTWGQS